MSDYENWNDEYQDDIESQAMPLIRQGQSNSPKVLEGVWRVSSDPRRKSFSLKITNAGTNTRPATSCFQGRIPTGPAVSQREDNHAQHRSPDVCPDSRRRHSRGGVHGHRARKRG